MSMFADKEYKQTMPEMIIRRWGEICNFQRECFEVEQKVLILFALALDVTSPLLIPGDLSDLT